MNFIRLFQEFIRRFQEFVNIVLRLRALVLLPLMAFFCMSARKPFFVWWWQFYHSLSGPFAYPCTLLRTYFTMKLNYFWLSMKKALMLRLHLNMSKIYLFVWWSLFLYSSNEIRETQNEHLILFCQNLTGL